MVKELAVNSAVLKVTGHKIPSKRMQDQDFVTRFMAFYLLGYENYEPDLDNFMNTCLEKINHGEISEESINRMKKDFIRGMELAYVIFGDDAFRKRESAADNRRPINKAYFEVIAVTLAKLDEKDSDSILSHKELFRTNLITEMHGNKSYNSSFSGGTGQPDNVKRRFSRFAEILRKSINNETINSK